MDAKKTHKLHAKFTHFRIFRNISPPLESFGAEKKVKVKVTQPKSK